MQAKYYVAMAYDAGEIGQSDYLYILKLSNGKIVGYAGEFEIFTADIGAARSLEKHHLAKWFSLARRRERMGTCYLGGNQIAKFGKVLDWVEKRHKNWNTY